MKYILAFGLGVPGVLVFAWFPMNHLQPIRLDELNLSNLIA
jgi:hypothetical protein